jgi:hypothetical protein
MASGLIISINQPVVASSPAMTVPQAVRRTGSQASIPVIIVCTAPSDSRIRKIAGSLTPSSLQAIK